MFQNSRNGRERFWINDSLLAKWSSFQRRYLGIQVQTHSNGITVAHRFRLYWLDSPLMGLWERQRRWDAITYERTQVLLMDELTRLLTDHFRSAQYVESLQKCLLTSWEQVVCSRFSNQQFLICTSKKKRRMIRSFCELLSIVEYVSVQKWANWEAVYIFRSKCLLIY